MMTSFRIDAMFGARIISDMRVCAMGADGVLFVIPPTGAMIGMITWIVLSTSANAANAGSGDCIRLRISFRELEYAPNAADIHHKQIIRATRACFD